MVVGLIGVSLSWQMRAGCRGLPPLSWDRPIVELPTGRNYTQLVDARAGLQGSTDLSDGESGQYGNPLLLTQAQWTVRLAVVFGNAPVENTKVCDFKRRT